MTVEQSSTGAENSASTSPELERAACHAKRFLAGIDDRPVMTEDVVLQRVQSEGAT